MTQKQLMFAREFIIDSNGARAARVVGCSERSAPVMASRWLSMPTVKQEIDRLRLLPAGDVNITREMVLKELARIGFSNISDFVDKGNNIKDLTSIDTDKTAAIASVKKVEYETEFGTKTTTSFTLWDKVSALEKLGKNLGVFEADNNQKRPLIQINVVD